MGEPTTCGRPLAIFRPQMRIGVLVTGDIAVRAAHSLSAHPEVDDVVVVGPATSRSFKVVPTAEGCDLLLGTGNSAPPTARKHGVPLLWDGEYTQEGVAVWGASVAGLTLALAAREADARLVALADPSQDEHGDRKLRFPDPVSSLGVSDVTYAGRPLTVGKSPSEFSACLVVGSERTVTIVDQAHFLAGVALAAAVGVIGAEPVPVWNRALTYLNTATEMGLVMGES